MVDYPKNEAKRAARARFTGLWAATVTLFAADGTLDEAALRRPWPACAPGEPSPAAALSYPHRLLPGSPGRTSPRPGRGRGR
jgi:hypothetical protein